MSEYQEYPKAMVHPHYKKGEAHAIPGTGRVDQRGQEIRMDFQGTADHFPPVLVHNQDQEEYHASKGYIPGGTMDASAFARGVAKPIPPGYEPERYPMWVGGALVNDEAEEHEARLAAGMDPLPETLTPEPGLEPNEQPVEMAPDLAAQLAAARAELAEAQVELAASRGEPAKAPQKTARTPWAKAVTRKPKIVRRARKAA